MSALVDFPDDCADVAFTRGMVENLIDRLRWMGTRRIYWNFYQEGLWSYFDQHYSKTRETFDNLGDPVAAGCRAAHERGLEFFATIKPYETGPSYARPASSPDNLALPGLPGLSGTYPSDQWALARPEMRVKGRTADIPCGLEKVPVHRIQLRQKDMSPVRIRPENIEIWTSHDNRRYEKRDLSFATGESVVTCPRDVVDIHGVPVTAKGDQVRALDLTDLHLMDPFIAVATNLDNDRGSFANTALEMVRVFGPKDRPLPTVVASHKAVSRPQRDLRTDDLEYDAGLGDFMVQLDVSHSRPLSPGWDGAATRDGVIAFARGRNEYLPGSLCEAYPEVREYWLSWVGQCIAAGVDGVDVRVSNHSSWTNTPQMYGFNEPVTREYRRRYGVDPDTEPYDLHVLGALRGEFFDEFLGAAKGRLAAAGKRLSVHAEMESFRPDATQMRWRSRPGNITFNWRGWLRSGLADEATLFGRAWDPDRLLSDSLVQEMLAEAGDAHVPVHLSRQVGLSEHMSEADKLEYTYRDGRLAGYCFYETASMYDPDTPVASDGRLNFRRGLLESIRDRAKSLGLPGVGKVSP